MTRKMMGMMMRMMTIYDHGWHGHGMDMDGYTPAYSAFRYFAS